MPTLKLLLSLVLGLGLVIAQAGTVYAAPPQQDDVSITGTVHGVEVEAGSESDSQAVVVTLRMKNKTQTVRVSLETGIALGLVALDESKYPVIVDSSFGTDVTIDLDEVYPGSSVVEHPVGSKVTDFFSNFMDVDYEMVSTSHSNSFGFGTITQALWMTEKLGGDATLFQTILTAKQTKDYQYVAIPGGEIPQNWGQFKKSVLSEKDNTTLGDVVSGNETLDPVDVNGHTDQGQSKDKDDDHNWRKDNPVVPPGQTKDKDNNGNGTNPVTPPGQNKDKDKEKDNNGNSGNPPGQDKDKDNSGNGKTK
jgi:hypothetical protein